jgi:hypothetical protein
MVDQEVVVKSVVCVLAVATMCSVSTRVIAQQGDHPDPGEIRGQQQQTVANPADSSYGGAPGGTGSGESSHVRGLFRHDGASTSRGDNCVGPVSYCNLYFGS